MVARPDLNAKRAMNAALLGRTRPTKELSELQLAAARAYGSGYTRNQLAKALLEHLTPTSVGRPMAERLKSARKKLKRWEFNQKFRDEVYNTALTGVDMAIPEILAGVTRTAKRGRVDAARLALELTGRHNPKGEQAAPTVVIAIDGIPRPQEPVQIEDAEIVEE